MKSIQIGTILIISILNTNILAQAGSSQLFLFNDKEDIKHEELEKQQETEMIISGYWENNLPAVYSNVTNTSDPNYYAPDVASMNRVFYSFLTLDQNPNLDPYANKYWNGTSIYETFSAVDILAVMNLTVPRWKNPNWWQAEKIYAQIEALHQNDKKFIWAIGGATDLKKTLKYDQVNKFVNICVQLLNKTGDGIDFDWEHLSDNSTIKQQQLQILALVLLQLRVTLDEAGLQDKQIGYTTRFNAFWDNSTHPKGYTYFATDGEGIAINNYLKNFEYKGQKSSLNQVINWANIMMYDVDPSCLDAKDNFTLQTYETVFQAVSRFVDKEKIIMGFEPGPQGAGGKWEGVQVDETVIDYIHQNGYGGVMFWAINDKTSGKNVHLLADYAKHAKNKFNQASLKDSPLQS